MAQEDIVGIYWPKDFPCWLLDSHEGQDEDIFARTEMDKGAARMRRMYISVPHIRKAALFLHGEMPAKFHAFYENDLDVGSRRFLAPFREIGGFVRYYVCEFVEPYKADYVALAGAQRAWRVECSFRLYGAGVENPYLQQPELSLELGVPLFSSGKIAPVSDFEVDFGLQFTGICAQQNLGELDFGLQIIAQRTAQGDLLGLSFGVPLGGTRVDYGSLG